MSPRDVLQRKGVNVRKSSYLAVVTVAAASALALVFVANAGAPNNRPKPPKPTCGVPGKPACPQPPPVPPAPPSGPVCPDGGPNNGGKDGMPGNDSCVRTTPPPPPAQVTPPPPPAAQVTCPKGMTEIGRTASTVMCSKTIVKVVTKKGKVVIKKAKPKTKFIRYCPRKPKDHGLAG